MTTNSSVAQAAVVPMRAGRVCLVLSTSGKRWVIPKGRIERRHTAGETALKEAWEEAGLLGLLRRHPVGSYRYEKCGQDFHVTVFFMNVTEVAESFPEKDRRVRRWVRIDRMLRYIGDPALLRLLQRALAPPKPEFAPVRRHGQTGSRRRRLLISQGAGRNGS